MKKLHEKKISELKWNWDEEKPFRGRWIVDGETLKQWAISKVRYWATLIPKEVEWCIEYGSLCFQKSEVKSYFYHRILAKMGTLIQEFELTEEDLK